MPGGGLSGRIRDFPAKALLQILCLSSRTGTLTLRDGTRRGRIDLQDGRIARASMVPAQTNLGDLLVLGGVLTAETLSQVVRRQSSEAGHRPLGWVAIQMGLADSDQVQAALRSQVLEVLHELMTWRNGEFNFETSSGLTADDITLQVPEMLLEATIELEALGEERKQGAPGAAAGRGAGSAPAHRPAVLFCADGPPAAEGVAASLARLGAQRVPARAGGAAARRIRESRRRGLSPVLVLDAADRSAAAAERGDRARECADRAREFLAQFAGIRVLVLHRGLSAEDRLRLTRTGVTTFIDVRPGPPGICVETHAGDLEAAIDTAVRSLSAAPAGDAGGGSRRPAAAAR